MAKVQLGKKAVGDIVKLDIGGTGREFIVVNQGKPSSIYDDSCNGTWLLMKEHYMSMTWHSTSTNSYKVSDVHSYLNDVFLNNYVHADIRNVIKQVKIPYMETDLTIHSGANGLSTKIFLLSGYELGWIENFPAEGAALSYFSGLSIYNARKRISYDVSGNAEDWWLRSPTANGTYNEYYVDSSGNHAYTTVYNYKGIRPALVLPDTLFVADDGTVLTNTAPTIASSSGASGVNLGTKDAEFGFKYTPSDADGDSLTITEKLDGVTVRTKTGVTSGTELTFEAASVATEFQKILNGSHTITVEVSDGQETSTFEATFTKAVYNCSITLKEPLAVAGDITVAIISIAGYIPADSTYKVEVTNNGNDDNPVWQDVTKESIDDQNIVFANKTAVNGAAFNFRITAERGESGTGGYITAVAGAFQ